MSSSNVVKNTRVLFEQLVTQYRTLEKALDGRLDAKTIDLGTNVLSGFHNLSIHLSKMTQMMDRILFESAQAKSDVDELKKQNNDQREQLESLRERIEITPERRALLNIMVLRAHFSFPENRNQRRILLGMKKDRDYRRANERLTRRELKEQFAMEIAEASQNSSDDSSSDSDTGEVVFVMNVNKAINRIRRDIKQFSGINVLTDDDAEAVELAFQ